MDLHTRHAIEHECARLSITYAHAVDFGRYDEFAGLFTEDGVLITTTRTEGRERIRRRMDARDPLLRSRHVLTNILVDVIDEATARGATYLTLYRHVGPRTEQPEPIEADALAAVGHYADEFTRVGDRWYFASRELEFAFLSPDALPELRSR